jgi:predicted peroxiredoxin
MTSSKLVSQYERLVLVRPREVDEALLEQINVAVAVLAGEARVVIDARAMRILSREQAERVRMLEIPKAAREAFLAGNSAVRMMQASRVARVQEVETRRVFEDAKALLEWMTSAASHRELARIRAFLDELAP